MHSDSSTLARVPFASKMPSPVPQTLASRKLDSDSVSDSGKRCSIRVLTGNPYNSLSPQSPCKKAYNQAPYRCRNGLSRSSAARKFAIASSSPSVPKVIVAKSPGSQMKRENRRSEKSNRKITVGTKHSNTER